MNGYLLSVCPKAPSALAQTHVNDITGYVLWGVIALFTVGLVVSIGAIVAGRIFAMPHASKVGTIGIAVVLLTGIAYTIAPGMVDGILGSGCI